MVERNFEIAKGFQTSVNIAFDLYNDSKINNFIPTISSMDIIEDVILSTVPKSTQRARILIGAYGRGKSHIILVLLSLLFRKNQNIFDNFLLKVKDYNPNLYEFTLEYLKSERKLLPIIVSGSNSSLTQSFLNALEKGLKAEGLDDLMPETHFKASINTIKTWRKKYPDTYKSFVEAIDEPIDSFEISLKEYSVESYEKFTKLYPTLTSGSTFNPFIGFDVIELYEKVVEKLKGKGFDGVYIIYDEFSKYLESSIANATIGDIKLLQDFAEKCDRSGNNQIHLLLISHKDISNYIDNNLPKQKVDGWRGVSGRFKHINIHNNFSQMYEIISAVIKKDPEFWNSFCIDNNNRFDDLKNRFSTNGLFDDKEGSLLSTVVFGCYPLHPISTFILPRLSEKVAQNERTLFTFLSADDKNTLSSFLFSENGNFNLLTPDKLYDYFEPLLRKEPYTSETNKLYKLTTKVLCQLDQNSLESKIIKTLSLIYIVEQFEKLPPVYNIIVDAYKDSVSDTRFISDAMTKLIENNCIVYLKRSNNYLKIKEASGIDIPKEIEKAIEINKGIISVKHILNKSALENYMYPTRYNDEHEITRFFDFTFIDSKEFWSIDNWEEKKSSGTADGVIFAIIPNDEEDIVKIREALLGGDRKNDLLMFVLPKKFIDIEKIALEYYAVLQLKSLVVEDELLFDEYDIYSEDLEEVIGSYIYSYTRPERSGAEYFYNGLRQNIYRKAQMSAFLSWICERTFPHTPIINNESINKNILPSVAVNSRAKILAGLLANTLETNLGLTGTGQDVSIMRSTLIRTGILVNADNNPTINMSPENENIRKVLHIIQDFFKGANEKGGQRFSVLYDSLTLSHNGIGLKTGVIPIFIAVVLHLFKNNLVIKYNNTETKITVDLLNNINECPDNYLVIIENWSDVKAKYMTGLEVIFNRHINEYEKIYNNFTYIVLAMNRWYMSLPKYSKEMTEIYLGCSQEKKFRPITKIEKQFVSSIKQADPNPREYLFEKLLVIFNQQDLTLNLLKLIEDAKTDFDSALTNLISVLLNDVKTLFSKCDGDSLTSAIKEWYENLSQETIQYLFSNNENRILDLMKSITNDEVDFIQRLCKTVTSLRVEDWNAATVSSFLFELSEFKQNVDNFNQNLARANKGSGMYKIIFTDIDGTEIIKTFFKDNYSNRAKLLFNDISTSLEEMGQSISEQEKRQVLMELLESIS